MDSPNGPAALLGQWATPCDAWGTPAECRLDWRAGLHPDHLRVDYSISALSDGHAIFSGTGTYRIGEKNLDGFWSDSNGAIHPLYAKWAANMLTTHWGTVATEQGKTEYRLDNKKTLRVTDWVLTPSGWRQFMQVEYKAAE